MTDRSIPVRELLVNPENPRFEPVTAQREAINLMVKELGSEIHHLAEDIVKWGLNPSKRLIVVKKGPLFLPLEGNRRVAALKLLHDPQMIADSKLRTKFAELRQAHRKSLPLTVECVVFPDEESASHWVMLEHTGKNKGVGVVPWNSTQSQRFVARQSGKKSRALLVFDLADAHEIDRANVDSSTLNRILATAEVRRQLGTDFSDNRSELTKPEPEVIQNLRTVFAAMSKKDFTVGEVYTAAQSKAWIERVLGASKAAQHGGEEVVGTKEKTPKTSTKKNPLAGDWVTSDLCRVYPNEDRVNNILAEITGVKPENKPNLCAVSLRVLLELATYQFLSEKGEIKAIISERKAALAEDNKNRVAKGQPDKAWESTWSPNFRGMLQRLSSNETLVPDPQTRKALNTFIGKGSTEPFLTELNEFIHNPRYEPGPRDVTDIWNKLGKAIFSIILSPGEK